MRKISPRRKKYAESQSYKNKHIIIVRYICKFSLYFCLTLSQLLCLFSNEMFYLTQLTQYNNWNMSN